MVPRHLRQSQDKKQIHAENPYLVARMEWNCMFYDVIKAKQLWQTIALGLVIVIAIALIGIITLAKKNHYIPYIVKVDALGQSQYVDLASSKTTLDLPEYRAFLSRYIIESRTVIADPVAQKRALDFVYHATKNPALKTINEGYQEHDPFELAKTQTRAIKINSILEKSDQSWQIHWSEIVRDLEGQVQATEHYEGLLTIKQFKIDDLDTISLNPLGLFVEHFHWTQQQ
jgi:type IV secretory pathway TrbF-like protein